MKRTLILLLLLAQALLGACGQLPATEALPTATPEPTQAPTALPPTAVPTAPPLLTPTSMPQPEGEFAVYDANPAYAIQYPAAWQIVQRTSLDTTLFLAPESGAGDVFHDNVAVTSQELADPTASLEAYTSEFLAMAPDAVADYELVSSEAASLAGLPAHRIIYRGSQNELPVQWLQVWTLVDGRAYILTYTAEPEEFEVFLPEANYMIQSFTLQ